MARHHRWSVSELLQWAEWGVRDERLPDLLRPQGLVWPRDGVELESACEALCAHYGRLPVMQALAGAVLAGGERAPGWARAWCAAHIDLQELGLGFDWEAALSMRWGAVPLALALGGFSRLDWVLVGVAPRALGVAPVPAWWGQVADAEARQAAEDVLALLHERAGIEAVLWPMVADTGRVRMRGPSLGLPLYLAARGLTRGPVPRNLLATGRLDGSGRLHPVEHLETKARLAASAGFHGLVAPASSRCGEAVDPGLEILEVTDLEQAEFLWEAYSPGHGVLLLQQTRCMDDPAWLAANVHLIRPEVLRRPHLEERLTRSTASILRRGELTRQWLRNVEQMVNRSGSCPESLRKVLDPATPERVRDLASEHPVPAFRVAQARVSFANHCGRIEESRCWADLSDGLLPALRVHENAHQMEEVAANRRFIAERHNRYDFRPEIPPDIVRILAGLEEGLELRRRREPRAVSAALGRLLGTLTQNCGFCGPDHLDSTRETAERARDAFGGGDEPEHREDWRRQFCYEAYALLDAGLHEEAQRVLTLYLGAPPQDLGEERLRGLGPHEHTVLARFLVETRTRAGGDWHRWAGPRWRSLPGGHPWQLWLLNAGFLTPDPGERELMWTRSVECCTAIGETAAVMALMPLGDLWAAGLGNQEWIREKTIGVMETLRTSRLNLDHFREVLDEPDWRGVLEIVRRGRRRFFPFSYR